MAGIAPNIYVDQVGLNGAWVEPGSTPSGDLSGRVTDQNGNGCEGCVVKSWGYDYANFSGARSQVESEIEDLRNELNDLRPDNFSTSKSIPGDLGGDVKYVAAHTQSDWGVDGRNLQNDVIDAGLGDADLSSPRIQFDTDDQIVLSVWDATQSGFLGQEALQAPLNQDLQGATVEERVRIQTLDPMGDVVDTSTVDPNLIGVSGVTSEEHHGVPIDLSPGFYRIVPATGGAGYPIVVGNPSEIAGQFESQLQNEIGSLTDYQERINSLIDEGKLTPKTTTTNESGYYSFTYESATLDQTSLTAYSVPDALGQVDPQNPPTKEDIRNHYENLSIESLRNATSFHTPDPTRSPTTSVPASNVTVGVREVALPDYMDANRSLERARQLAEEFLNESWSDLSRDEIEQFLTNDRGKLEDLYNETTAALPGQVTDGTSLCELTTGGCDGSGDSPLDEPLGGDLPPPTDINTGELKEIISNLEEQVNNIPNEIPLEQPTNISTGLDSIGSTWTLPGQIPAGNVSAYAIWGNGTRQPVPDEYVSVDQSTLTGVGAGTTTVRIADFPVGEGDPNSVRFELRALSSEGFGEFESPVATNPTFTGDVPEIRSLRLNTLEPAAGSTFELRVQAAERSSFERLANVTATAEDGTEVPASVTDAGRVQIQSSDPGRYEVEYVVEDDEGNQYTDSLVVPVRGNDVPRPPTVRAQSTQFGSVAVVGDGFTGGSVDTSVTGNRVTLSGTVDEDLGDRPHYYANSLASGPRTTIEAQVLKGDERKQYGDTVSVAIHVRPIEGDVGDDVLIYRQTEGGALQPIQPGGSAYGAINSTADGTTIQTYGPGGASVVVNREPGFVAGLMWDLRSAPVVGGFFQGGVPIIGFIAPIGGTGALALGLVVWPARRRSRGDHE